MTDDKQELIVGIMLAMLFNVADIGYFPPIFGQQQHTNIVNQQSPSAEHYFKRK